MKAGRTWIRESMPSKFSRAGGNRSVLVVSLNEGRALVIDENGKLTVLEFARPPVGGGWIELKHETKS